MKKQLLILFILLLQWINAFSQIQNKAKLDSLFLILEGQHKAMGHLSVFQNGKEIYTYSTGYSHVAKQLPNTQHTKYRIGSVSKMITATIIMQLIEEGKLSAATKLATFYPEIPNADTINILHLLQHKSGLKNTLQDVKYRDWRKNAITKQEMLQIILNLGSNFRAGEKQEYSNTNYVLLSYIAENIEKKPFSEIIRKRIAKPLKLKNTSYGTVLNPNEQEAISYHKKDSWIPAEETHFSVALGAGAIISTPKDLNTFTTALFEGKLLKDSSLKLMQEMQGEYGIGLKQMDVQGLALIGHSGGIDGFKAVAFYSPSDNMAFSFSSNGGDISLSELLWAVSSIATNREYDLPNFNTRKTHTPEDLEKLLGTYEDKASQYKLYVKSDGGSVTVQEGPDSKGIVLDAVKKNKFRMGLAGATFEFNPETKTLTADFDGEKITFTKI